MHVRGGGRPDEYNVCARSAVARRARELRYSDARYLSVGAILARQAETDSSPFEHVPLRGRVNSAPCSPVRNTLPTDCLVKLVPAVRRPELVRDPPPPPPVRASAAGIYARPMSLPISCAVTIGRAHV